jgi:chemotaxis protein methyltransferase CheR
MAATAFDYAYLRQIVLSYSHNVLEPSSDYLFDTRLSHILQRNGLAHPGELVRQLRGRSDSSLERAIAEAMTINETSFFRDGRPFTLLRNELLPKLIAARRATRTLRFWSAACSTGQEALSLAILIREHFPFVADWNIRIDGTDVSAAVVRRAREGRYHRIEVNRGLSARLISRYFKRDGDDWIARPEIHTFCDFREANLCTSPPPISPPAQFDLILLRNVMLYFSLETRRAVLNSVHGVLAPDGCLFLGSTEQPADPSRWVSVLAGGTCYLQPSPPAPVPNPAESQKV